ncbi:hypothetical protein [Amycolatopsis sp. GM8]|uniref:hypothetical protein n=1 Tax=Amycolatopsis sp. GM8 TaxID=2896530 RepID=UPI001F1A140D|nr:hypothetical protein [Amycolatopsis sp. GM8]
MRHRERLNRIRPGRGSAPEPAPFPRAARILGTIIAPTTLVTALLFYFGARHANWFCRHFGVHYTTLDFSPQDYLIRSSDGLFVPMAALAVTGLVLLWGFRLLRRTLRPPAWDATLRVLTPVTVGLGVVLAGAGLANIADPALLYDYPGLPGLGLAAGFALFMVAQWLHRERTHQRRRAAFAALESVCTFVLISVGLFWAVNDYSAAIGELRGAQYEQALPTMPDAVVLSSEPLGIAAPGITETAYQSADGKSRFRYDGLVLVLESGNKLFLLPKTWTPETGGAIVLARTDSIELEFNLPAPGR